MKVVSFFSGLGGLDKGFVDTGYDIIWANDFDKYAVQTYKANFGEHIVFVVLNVIPFQFLQYIMFPRVRQYLHPAKNVIQYKRYQEGYRTG